ncbi:MAG: hypothetical protein AB8B96_14815 [Lysobacterales bacterium]
MEIAQTIDDADFMNTRQWFIALTVLGHAQFSTAQTYPTSVDQVGITASACPNFPGQTLESLTITTPGQLLENVRVNGRINIEAPNVTLRCVTANAGLYALRCFANEGCTDLLVENSEFSGAASAAMYFVGQTNAMIRHSSFGQSTDGLKVNASGNTFDYNFLTCLNTTRADAHMDGLQSRTGNDNVYINNSWQSVSCPQSANQGGGSGAFFIEDGAFTRTYIAGNYFSGAGYSVRLRAENSDHYTFINNVVERDSYQFGPLVYGASSGLCAHWSGNTYHDGEPWLNGSAEDPACALPAQLAAAAILFSDGFE